LFEPVTVNKKRHESYASSPTKVKGQRNAKRRQDYQQKKVDKEASAAVAAQQHQEVTPVCQRKGDANLVVVAKHTQEFTPESMLINLTPKSGFTTLRA
jgi:hypothetical protein